MVKIIAMKSSFLADRNLIRESLLRVAFFAESHSIKGLLAVEELSEFLPEVEPDFWLKTIGWNQVLDTPKIHGFIHDQVEAPNLSRKKMESLIRGSVFPIAYLAGAQWIKQASFSDLIHAFKLTAIERIGYLGHSWTIWCSFHELEPRLNDLELKLLAAERFVEFVSSALSQSDGLPEQIPTIELTETTEQTAIASVCKRPGFLGHSLITLSHLFRYRHLFSNPEWQGSLARVVQMTRTEDHLNKLIVSASGQAIEPLELPHHLEKFLRSAQPHVHSLTLANSVRILWNFCLPAEKAHLLEVLSAISLNGS